MADEPSDGLVKPEEEEGSTIFFDFDLSRLPDNPRALNIETISSFNERPLRKDAVNQTWFFTQYVDDAREAFRRSLVDVPGLPVWTVAELGNSSEELNYDQVVHNKHWQNNLFYEAPPVLDHLSLPPGLTSDSESWMASDSTDAAEKNNPLKQGKKRKIDSDTIPSVNRIVTAAIRYNDDVEILNFTMSFGLSNLKEKVAQRFKLNGKSLHLKYIDEEEELILIACDVDLRLAVDTTSIDNRINLICVSDVGPPTGVKLDVNQPSLESVVADNFTFLEYLSDAESLVATGSIDAGEKSRQGKKRKIESDTLLPVTGMVTAKITSNEYMKKFQFFISSGLLNLENEVARSFKLKGKKLRLKYWDEDGDFILIACDVDLALAVVTTGSNNIINLICLSD